MIEIEWQRDGEGWTAEHGDYLLEVWRGYPTPWCVVRTNHNPGDYGPEVIVVAEGRAPGSGAARLEAKAAFFTDLEERT